jgi:hypothetical protein
MLPGRTIHIRMTPQLWAQFKRIHTENFRGLSEAQLLRYLLAAVLEQPDKAVEMALEQIRNGATPPDKEG